MEKYISVSELVKDIKTVIESSFGFVVIQGEVSNIHAAYSGHNFR